MREYSPAADPGEAMEDDLSVLYLTTGSSKEIISCDLDVGPNASPNDTLLLRF